MIKLTLSALFLTVSAISYAQDLPSNEDILKQQAEFARTTQGVMKDTGGTIKPQNRIGSAVKDGIKPAYADPSDVAKRIQNVKRQENKANELMVFVSLSMPDEVLSDLSKQAKQRGATLMLRGFASDSLEKTRQAVYEVNKSGSNWQINPNAFKVFNIKTVPAFVIASAEADNALEDGCAQPSNYSLVEGNQSIDVALQTIRRKSSNKALAAEADLRLRTNY